MKKLLPLWLKQLIKRFFYFFRYCGWVVRSEYNALRLDSLLKTQKKIHLGCGNIHYKDFINIDFRATLATDLARNCSNLDFLPNNSADVIFANAFLEHLYLSQRQTCINEIYRVLDNNGKAILLSIPDFEEIAKAYLKKQKIHKQKVFDLYEVYRFTHGEPEQAPTWWLEQLHKSLFDTSTLISLLKNAGFLHFVIFRCNYAQELTSVNLGVIAYKTKPQKKNINKQAIAELFNTFKLNFNPKTITIVYNSL